MGRLTRAEVNAVCDYLEQRIHLEPAAVRAALAPYTEGEEPKAEDPHEWDGIHGGHRKRTDAEMDRMVETTRAAASPASEGPQGKTVRVRESEADIARDRLWCAASLAIPSSERLELLEAFHKLREKHYVPLPAPAAEIQGSVTP